MKQVIRVQLNQGVFYFTRPAYKEWRLSLSTGDFHTHTKKLMKRVPKGAVVTDLKTLRLESFMPILAEGTGLAHDGAEDNRLFDEIITADSLVMSEDEYAAMEKDVNSFSIRGKGFVVGAWNDCSGFGYWNLRQQENNYIQITAYISDPRKVVVSELRSAIRKARNHFAKYNLEF